MMKRLQHTPQHSRRDAVASCGWATSALTVTPFVGVVVMLDTPVTAKINPRWVPGGLPEEGNP